MQTKSMKLSDELVVTLTNLLVRDQCLQALAQHQVAHPNYIP